MDEFDKYVGESYVSWEFPVVIYPGDPQAMDPSVPENIANSYLEARRVYRDASGPTAAAIMCRRTLEGICDHFGAEGGNLVRKLDSLNKEGIIDKKIHQWANDVLRALGNNAAHDVDTVIRRQDAEDALEFTKAIVEYLFVFEEAFRQFTERRKKSDEPSPLPT
jgi:hypothetical protein